MKRLLLAIVIVCSVYARSYAQVPLGDSVFFDCPTTLHPTTGVITVADSTPTFNVYENATDTAILNAQNLTVRNGHTGEYRGTFTASGGNGFEVGKYYIVKCYATVASLSQNFVAAWFRVVAAETTAGTPKVNPSVLDTDVISSASVSAAAVTKIQTNLLTIVKNTTVSNYYFKLTKAGAAYTGGTSATITCTVSKDGGAFAGCAAGTQSAISEVSVGWYKTNLQAADVNANILVLKFAVPTDSAVVPWEQEITPGR